MSALEDRLFARSVAAGGRVHAGAEGGEEAG